MVVNSYVISITKFLYFFFNCRYLKIAMYCFIGNIPRCIKVLSRILEFLIGIVEEFLCCNYSSFPIVGSHKSKQVLIWVFNFWHNDSLYSGFFHLYYMLATKWLRILSLGGTDKIRNYLVANPIVSRKDRRHTDNVDDKAQNPTSRKGRKTSISLRLSIYFGIAIVDRSVSHRRVKSEESLIESCDITLLH